MRNRTNDNLSEEAMNAISFSFFLILGFLNNEDEETIKKVNGICERECFEEFADI